jgi:hypothetical protein
VNKFLLAAAFGATLIAAPAFAQDGAPQRGGGMAAMLDRLDTNHDGVITKDEFNADLATRFAALDTNKDGKVSEEERNAGGPAGKMMGRGVTGDVTLADAQAAAGTRFDRMDANHDGKIDQAEREAMRARMGNRQAPPPADAN